MSGFIFLLGLFIYLIPFTIYRYRKDKLASFREWLEPILTLDSKVLFRLLLRIYAVIFISYSFLFLIFYLIF